MVEIKFQGTVIKFLLALLIVSIIVTLVQNGTPVSDPNGFVGTLGFFALLILIITSIRSLIKIKEKVRKKK